MDAVWSVWTTTVVYDMARWPIIIRGMLRDGKLDTLQICRYFCDDNRIDQPPRMIYKPFTFDVSHLQNEKRYDWFIGFFGNDGIKVFAPDEVQCQEIMQRFELPATSPQQEAVRSSLQLAREGKLLELRITKPECVTWDAELIVLLDRTTGWKISRCVRPT